ncbi:putative polygalacturonase [Frankliniella fusca]|uniref:Polygalacturonase n=1 Tax=Frankliniella fusca TaxID=407009 RepID=A0AAE1LK40_9NEOP|nr:putative polygalacturonase [Frankliniella fusca]
MWQRGRHEDGLAFLGRGRAEVLPEAPSQFLDAETTVKPSAAADGQTVVLDANSPAVKAKAQKLSAQIHAILEHFKQDDPTGFPGAEVPDPMSVPAMNSSFAIATMEFMNVSVHGLSQFRFHEGTVNVTAMKCKLTARIESVLIVGNYTLCTWLSCSSGGFTVTLDGVLVSGVAGLEVGPRGRLRAEEIGMDVTFQSIAMDFKNLGFMMSMFQGMINKVGSFLFDNIKPFILSEVNAKMRAEVDQQVAAVDIGFPSSLAPIDVMVAEARHTVRSMGLDPYHLPDIVKKAGPFEAAVSSLFARGLSSFYRKGDVALWMRERVLHAVAHVATKELTGTCRWLVHAPGLPGVLAPLTRRAGDASFTVEYLEARMVFNQSLDTRRHPYLEELDITLGPMQLVSRGDAGRHVNALAEFSANVLPNLLRYQIVDALEAPIRRRVQDVLDKVNVEELINDKLDDIDGMLAAAGVTTLEPSGTTTAAPTAGA